jgi:hypothetical protein
MARKRTRRSIFVERTQDPGKDLFAYLFMMVMVFSFMLIVAAGEMKDTISGQNGPEQKRISGKSTLTAVSFSKIGRLEKKNNEIFLAFDKELYHPQKDAKRLEKDGRLAVIAGNDGIQKKLLYLEADQAKEVLLSEYLAAFQYLSEHGIGVAFAKRFK